MGTRELSPVLRALEVVAAQLEAAGIASTRDAGSFLPDPVAVLVGLPALVSRGLSARTYAVPVRCVSGRPLTRVEWVDALYSLADRCTIALGESEYVPTEWAGGLNADPLPALLLTVTVTVPEWEGPPWL